MHTHEIALIFTLVSQLARDASNNLGAMTPHMRHKKQMADKLVDAFPKYSKDAVADYAMGELAHEISLILF